MKPRRWIVFGGSFDPPHRAHLDLPRRAAEAIGAERVLYVPARINPLKQRTPPASPEDRLEMLRLALDLGRKRASATEPACEIRTLELDREGPSYMADTLRELSEEARTAVPSAQLVLLVGSDAALGLPRWRDPEAIAAYAEIAVMLRPPHDEASFREAYGRAWGHADAPPAIPVAWVLDLGADPASSTAARIGDDDGVPAAVREHIEKHGLYRS